MYRLGLTTVGIASIAASLLLVASGTAAPRYSGTITASFTAPVLSGTYLSSGSHQPVPRDNSGTARHSGVGTATITWGGAAPSSSVTFAGDAFTDVAPGQVIRLGTLTFLNGPDLPDSLIFGFDMQLSAGDAVAPFAGLVELISTQNTNADRVADADVLSFGDIDTPSTLAGFEGTTVTAIVNGAIGDDARLRVTSIALAPGENRYGCVDEGPFVAARGPCTASCGDLCVALGSTFTQPLCGTEELPRALAERLRKATGSLGQGATAGTRRETKRAVGLAMSQLRSSAVVAGRASKRGQLSTACAEAIGAAVANADAKTAPLLRAR